MKLNLELTKQSRATLAGGRTKTPPRVNQPTATAKPDVLKPFRLLKSNEVVGRGDFVADEHCGFQPWEGPGGFRADAFVKPIYRRDESRSPATKKSK